MKIRGNAVGTSIKPERSVVMATGLTDDQKEQARANIGVDVIVAQETQDRKAEVATERKRIDSLSTIIAQETTDRKAEVAIERERIDNLSTLEEGSTTGDAELTDIRVGAFEETYSGAGNAVRGQIGMVSNESVALADDTGENAELLRLSGGHFYKIHTDRLHKMEVYQDKDNNLNVYETKMGSGYIKCPKYVCLHIPDTIARCYLYFYRLTDGQYTITWDVIDKKTSGGLKNYFNSTIQSSGNRVIEIPDDAEYYLRFYSDVGNCSLYA